MDRSSKVPEALPVHPRIEPEPIRRPRPLWQKMKDDPWVTLGMAATAGVLATGIYSLKIGDPKLSQRMMRARVALQGTTLLLITVALFQGTRKARREEREEQHH